MALIIVAGGNSLQLKVHPHEAAFCRAGNLPQNWHCTFVLHLAQHVRNLMLQQRTVASKAVAKRLDGVLPASIAQSEQRTIPAEYLSFVVRDDLVQLILWRGAREGWGWVYRQIFGFILKVLVVSAAVECNPLQG